MKSYMSRKAAGMFMVGLVIAGVFSGCDRESIGGSSAATIAPTTAITAPPSPDPQPDATEPPDASAQPTDAATATADPATPDVQAARFSADDLAFDALDMAPGPACTTLDEFLLAFGEPLSRVDSDEEAGISVVRLVYPFAEAWFTRLELDDAHQLTYITITSDEIEGPRGLKVGDRASRVLELFPTETQDELDGASVLYYFDIIDEGARHELVPPMGTYRLDADGSGNARLAFPTLGEPRTPEDVIGYAYLPHADLSISFSASRVESITVTVGTYEDL